jgi:predicted site-specific integrase-resolvase
MNGGVSMVDLAGDLTLVTWTTAQAAQAAGVTPDVIYQWKARGKIKPVNQRGRPRYRALDVLQAEAATRGRAHRVHAA